MGFRFGKTLREIYGTQRISDVNEDIDALEKKRIIVESRRTFLDARDVEKSRIKAARSPSRFGRIAKSSGKLVLQGTDRVLAGDRRPKPVRAPLKRRKKRRKQFQQPRKGGNKDVPDLFGF